MENQSKPKWRSLSDVYEKIAMIMITIYVGETERSKGTRARDHGVLIVFSRWGKHNHRILLDIVLYLLSFISKLWCKFGLKGHVENYTNCPLLYFHNFQKYLNKLLLLGKVNFNRTLTDSSID